MAFECQNNCCGSKLAGQTSAHALQRIQGCSLLPAISLSVGAKIQLVVFTTGTKSLVIPFLMILGVFGYFGQVFMTKAFQTASTNIVAPIKYFEVIYTATFGVFLFGEIYTLYSFLGIFLIIGGLILNILYKSKFNE